MSNFIDLVFIFGAKYLYLVVVVISFVWFLNQPKFRKREVLITACICLFLIFVISKAAGHFYYNPRPFVAGNFEPLIAHSPDNGFPSHHMLLVSAVSAVIFLFNRRLSLVFWVLSVSVGFSRVYCGVHHLADIWGSILISVVSAAMTYFFVKYLKSRKLRIFLEE